MSAEPIDYRAVPTVPPPEGRTVADVDALPDRDGVRYELVDGVPKVMTPPCGDHQDALLELHMALRGSVPPDLHVVQGLGVILADDQRPIPDLIVVSGGRPRTLSNVPAERVVLAAEIVSRSSRSDDRFRKPASYAQAGIPCYLRVELDPVHVVAYLLGPDGVYEEAGRAASGETLHLDDPFPITLDPAALVR
jgi:Uma2 family endonuclease